MCLKHILLFEPKCFSRLFCYGRWPQRKRGWRIPSQNTQNSTESLEGVSPCRFSPNQKTFSACNRKESHLNYSTKEVSLITFSCICCDADEVSFMFRYILVLHTYESNNCMFEQPSGTCNISRTLLTRLTTGDRHCRDK